MRVVTTFEMKEIERRADQSGLSYYQMMENAGTRAFEIIRSEYPKMKFMTVFCGKGNNGGDGFVVARLAAENEISVTVVLVEGEPVTKDAITNYHMLPVAVKTTDIEAYEKTYNASGELKCDIAVDAVYGTGFHGQLRENGKKATAVMKKLKTAVISLDIPSGCNADTGEVSGGAVNADITVVFDSFKHIHEMNVQNCGRSILADIGIPKECH